jgi:hypothetical protein
VVCIFPEGKLTRDGEMSEFKRGVEKNPGTPARARGADGTACLWGSFFSRRDGRAAMTQMPSRFWSRNEVVATAPVHGDGASATGLQKIVAGLRADWQ